MKKIRNDKMRLFDKDKIEDFKIIITNDEISDKEESYNDFDYNKFFLDLIDDKALKTIAENKEIDGFVEYIFSKLNKEDPEILDEYSNVPIQDVCSKEFCVSAYGLIYIAAAALVQFTLVAIDTTFPYTDPNTENIFLDGTYIVASILGDKAFADEIKAHMVNIIKEEVGIIL